MHPEVAANPDASARFIREAQVCARLQHPNVVDVYDVLTEEASLFLVMECWTVSHSPSCSSASVRLLPIHTQGLGGGFTQPRHAELPSAARSRCLRGLFPPFRYPKQRESPEFVASI